MLETCLIPVGLQGGFGQNITHFYSQLLEVTRPVVKEYSRGRWPRTGEQPTSIRNPLLARHMWLGLPRV